VWRLAVGEAPPRDEPRIGELLGEWRLTAEAHRQAVWSLFA